MKKKEAFTLIELLLAVSISSVIILGIYSALQTGIISYEKNQSASELYQAAMIILNRLESDIKNSYVYSQQEPGFKGSQAAATLEFCALTPILPGRIKYALENQSLKRSLAQGLALSAQNPQAQTQELSSRVKAFFLEFAYLDNTSGSIVWGDSWPITQGNLIRQGNLPLAVRVKLGLIEKGRHGEETGVLEFIRTFFLPLGEGS